MKLIKKNGNIENVIATISSENVPSFEEIKEIRKIFLKPDVIDDYELVWNVPNSEKVIKILCDNHHFSRERVEPVLQKYSNVEQMVKQKTLY